MAVATCLRTSRRAVSAHAVGAYEFARGGASGEHCGTVFRIASLGVLLLTAADAVGAARYAVCPMVHGEHSGHAH